jgi:Flp pilus assembly protein TadD
VWSAIGAALAGPLASRFSTTRARRARVAFALTAIAIGAASLARAAPRIASRSSLWREALTLNPGDVSAALRVSEERRGTHDRRGALEVLLACSRVNSSACGCAEAAASDAIDLGRFADARAALEASTACARTPHRIALEAETAIGGGSVAEGRRQADVACALDPNDAHALYARGWATMLAGEAQQARPDAERAVQLGRGEPANLLLGLLLFGAGDLAGAEAQFRAALTSAPDDPRATYDLALVADRRQQFHDAREGYLRALRLDPTMADARVNLAVLTYSRGAVDEAQHHVEELLKIAPNDARIPSLFQMLSKPPPRAAMTLGR